MNNQANDPNTVTEVLRYSFRLRGRSTSITLRKNIVSLWIVLSDYKKSEYPDKILQFIDASCDKWENDTAKGLSDFITTRMIKSVLQKKDFRTYKRVLIQLSKDL